MPLRWLWWAPLGALLLGSALIGLRAGWLAETITETDVITHYAQRYLQEHGANAALSDCAAVPGEGLPGIWIVITCQPNNSERRYAYYVNRWGGFEYRKHPTGHAITEPHT